MLIALFTFNVSQAQLNCPGSDLTGTNAGFKLLGTFNGHTYYISICGGDNNDGRFRGSQISSAIAGTIGYAATLHTAEENAFVARKILKHNGNLKAAAEDWGSPRNAWIGLTDNSNEGQFVWASGEPVCYENWNEGEPNNYGEREDYAEMLIMENFGSFTPFGKWNDWFNDDFSAGEPGANPTRLPIILEIGTKVVSCTPSPECNLTVSTSLAALSCGGPNVIYLGYGPQSVTATSNQTGTTFEWYKIGSPTSIAIGATFSPTQSGIYYVVATNGNCTASTKGTALEITVIDIRCGNNKVYVCHKQKGVHGNGTIQEQAHTLCVSVNAVAAHLAHGDCLGECPDANKTSSSSQELLSEFSTLDKDFAVSGYPNPTRSSFSLQIDGLSTENVSIRVTDMTGRLIEHRTKVPANQTLQIGSNYKAGLYYVEVIQGANKRQLKLIKQ